MDEKKSCPKCEGCGRVDSRDSKPWSIITATVNPEVRAGVLTPKPCDQCRGTGQVPTKQVPPAQPQPKPEGK